MKKLDKLNFEEVAVEQVNRSGNEFSKKYLICGKKDNQQNKRRN